MAGHNDISDALASFVNDIDAGVRFYPEPEPKPDGTGGKVNGEVFFSNLQRIGNGPQGRWTVDATIELSTPANLPGWSGAVRRIRAMCDPSGATSILAAIEENAGDEGTTLGGVVVGCLPMPGSSTAEEMRKKFDDGDRWCKELRLKVTFAP